MAGTWMNGDRLAHQQTLSEEQSSGHAAAHQYVRTPQGDVIEIPRAEDGHYGEFNVSDDGIKKHGGLLYLHIIAVENLTHSIKKIIMKL